MATLVQGAVDFSSLLSLGDAPVVGQRGNKSVSLSPSITFQLCPYARPLTPAFALGSMDPESTRHNLDLRPSPDLEEFARSFDAWLVSTMATNSEQIWKRAYSVEELSKDFNSIFGPEWGEFMDTFCRLSN